jgi:hypothetical protein
LAEALTLVTTVAEPDRSQPMSPRALADTATTKAAPKREMASITSSDDRGAPVVPG